MTVLDAVQWSNWLERFPTAHLLQTAEWGEFKAAFGWQPLRLADESAAAQVLFRRLPLGLTIAYLPKGPLGSDWVNLLRELDEHCRQRRAVFLKVEPDCWEDDPEYSRLRDSFTGWVASRPVQPRRTVEISLTGSEEDWLSRMKQKTRYNIRLAQRKEVVVERSSDVDLFYRMMITTGKRDGFGVHSLAYYQRVYDLFAPNGMCVLLVAKYQQVPLAGLMAFAFGQRAWYFYGASSNEERHRMPTYLLQWEAMRWAASRGCTVYDLWGIPDEDEEVLETQFSAREDGLWGVYRFKRGFGGKVRRSAGAWDRVYQPLLYTVYQQFVARRKIEG
ncbi:MAG: peptidoglycan bridge formation glycyltransferase FemA/FemB family protein [Chloroflexota bacterium]|nr:MAG: hypothetical protein KatS3mg045_1140 [Bellilinea sp.]